MPGACKTIVLFMLATLIVSCGAPVNTLSPTATIASPTSFPTASATTEPLPPVSIARYPEPADYSHLHPALIAIPTYDPRSAEAWQVDPQIDLRSQDLTQVEMTNSLGDLLSAAFDSTTRWPSTNAMPAGFDPQEIMEVGKDPGLGIRSLHAQGITGEAVGIAMIDQTLLVDHVEYKDQVRLYEETSDKNVVKAETSMHGAGVASIAVGKTIGVAPGADLYYIEAHHCNSGGANNFNYDCLIQAIKRIVEINRTLPTNRKIRVLSISQWSQGIQEIKEAVKEAREAQIFIISPGLYESYGFHFEGLGREPLSNPNQFESYLPAPLWTRSFYQGRSFQNTLLIPMDSRTTASPTGVEDYVFYRWGDKSWTIPYLAGVYALASQVKPDIAPEEFWEIALSTGKTTHIQHGGKDYELGLILDPQALIAAIKNK